MIAKKKDNRDWKEDRLLFFVQVRSYKTPGCRQEIADSAEPLITGRTHLPYPYRNPLSLSCRNGSLSHPLYASEFTVGKYSGG